VLCSARRRSDFGVVKRFGDQYWSLWYYSDVQ
jgi:hypothetical protein